MRIGIMTFPNSRSYGATLQMYATYKCLRDRGYDTEIINYQNKYMKMERHIRSLNSISAIIRLLGRKIMHHHQSYVFKRFEKNMVCFPQNPLHTHSDLKKCAKRYNYVICGSDQVWNPYITGNDLSYFLDFCGNETQRIAYAPSFGITEFTENFKNRIRPELEKFSSLSVREKEGQIVLKEILNKDVQLVLDPTFFLEKSDWVKEEAYHKAASEPYILYYTVKGSKRLYSLCLDYAKKKNLKMVIVGGNVLSNLKNNDKNIVYAADLSPRQWLYLVHHAECVFTNSFHGTAFSINYQKNFYVEFSSKTNSRLAQIITTSGLAKRVIVDDFPDKEDIDYTLVVHKLSEIRKRSIDYLLQSLK